MHSANNLSQNSSSDAEPLQYESFHRFAFYYGCIHGYLAFPICLLGICFNVLNVLVLCRREMRSATNFMLSSIAVCHTALMSIYIVYVSHMHLAHPDSCDPQRETYGWAVFTLIYANVTFTVYGLSTWLTVNLALIRCLVIRSRDSTFTKIGSAVWLCAATTSMVLISCVPNYLSFSIVKSADTSYCSNASAGPRYSIGPSSISERNENLPLKLTFMISGILFFLVPCCLLTAFMAYLISSIATFKQRRSLLIKTPASGSGSPQNQQQTAMLLVILGIFLITQLPQGILALLCSFLSKAYRLEVYQNLGEMMELLSLINASVNFVLYCAMSSQFRLVFISLFCQSRKTTCDHPKTSIARSNGRQSVSCRKCSSSKTSRSSSFFGSESSPLVNKSCKMQSVKYSEDQILAAINKAASPQRDKEFLGKVECFEVAL